jgi:hypothetical protein
MVLGSFLADAAGMSLHWVYSQSEIKDLVGAGSPFFFSPPSCPFYSYPLGSGTPYGQQTQVTLSVGAAGGGWSPAAYEAAYYALYKAGGPASQQSYYFDVRALLSRAMCVYPANARAAVALKPTPPHAALSQASTKEFVSNVAAGRHWPSCGGNDDQADAVAHVVPVVALFGGNTSLMLSVADTVIRVTQNTDKGVAFGLAAARVLEHVLVGGLAGGAAVAAAVADMRKADRAQPYAQDAALATRMEEATSAASLQMDYSAFVLANGQSCDWPFQLSAVANLLARGSNYTAATSLAIFAGGDSASRNMFAGAANAAMLGDKAALPADWVAKTTAFATLAPLAAKLVAQRRA